MTIAELHQKYPIADWVQMLRHLTPNDISLPERVIVTAPKFFETLTDWLANSATRDDGVTIQNLREFFIIKTIMANVDHVDKNIRELYRDMNSKIASGTTEAPPRSRACVSLTSNNFGQLLGRYFVMRNFGGEPQRQQVAKFMDNIQSSWTQRLQDVKWLDYETRARAIEKVGKLKHKEAYSIVTPDDRSPESLERYYADIQVDAKDFYANQKSAQVWNMKKEWSKVGQKVDKTEWYMNPHEVNAYYTPTFNEIVLPAGILQAPFYHSKLPQYLNYGGIGVVIGHEITVSVRHIARDLDC
jgi:predicted metalloendopeptidase